MRTVEHLHEVLTLRRSAYGRHAYKDELITSLPRPDAIDLGGYSTTLVAVDKDKGDVVGTVRLTCSVDGRVDLPDNTPDDECLHDAFAYVDRLAVAPGENSAQVASALMKATWLWARGRDARWLVALALAPLARVYRRRGGLAVRAGGQPVLMEGYHNEPYQLLAATLSEAYDRLAQENPEYSRGFIDRVHPDICVHAMSVPWTSLAANRQELVRRHTSRSPAEREEPALASEA